MRVRHLLERCVGVGTTRPKSLSSPEAKARAPHTHVEGHCRGHMFEGHCRGHMGTVLVAGSGSGTSGLTARTRVAEADGPGPLLVRMRPGPSRGPGAGAGPARRTAVGGLTSIEQESGRHLPTEGPTSCHWTWFPRRWGSRAPWPQTSCQADGRARCAPRGWEHVPCGVAQCPLQGQHPGPEQGALGPQERRPKCH